jgi:hypothetical protein
VASAREHRTIGFLRTLLSQNVEQFPVLLAKVVYNGIHSGDSLSLDDVESLRPEMDRLRAIHCDDQPGEDSIRQFERQISELIEAARQVGKPIVF